MIDEKKLLESLIPLLNEHGNMYFAGRIIGMIDSQPKIGEWIPCSERLPEEKINPFTNDFYEYQVTYKSKDVTDVRHYKFGRGHWWHGAGIMDEYVIAWQPLPEPYKP